MNSQSPCNRFFTTVALVLLLGAAPTAHADDPAPASPDATIEQQVLATNTGMIAAANRLDVDAFFDFIVDTDKGMIVQNGVIFRTRREAYEAVKRGLQGVVKLDRRIDHPHVTVLGADAALLVGDGSATATLEDSRVMTSRFAVSLVFVRHDRSWKLLHGHYSMLPASR